MSEEPQLDGPDAAIVADEEKLLARVQARAALGDRDRRLRVVASDIDAQLITLRDAIGEAKPEDLAPLVEEMTRLSALRGQLGGSRSLPIDTDAPYFAHMRLREADRRRDVLVGKRGFIDRDSNVQIVDWRNAPISQVYYRYEEGDDYDEEIAGRSLEGIIEVRRNLSISKGRLRRIGAPQGTFVRDANDRWHKAVGQAAPVLQGGQGVAARPPRRSPRDLDRDRSQLGVHHGPVQRADKHMPEIAALIDRDQFDLITQPGSGLLLIDGGAGSGKTTVALHRIAYLNFADRRRFRPKHILFVVPSQALVRYVEGVLPALGVRGVPVSTYVAWARSQRLRTAGGGGKYNHDAPAEITRVKKHPRMLAILADFVAAKVVAVSAALVTSLSALKGGDAILGRWHEPGQALVPRLRQLYRWVGEEPRLSAATRRAAESTIARLGRRSTDVLADWAELMTDRPALAAGFAGCPEISARDLDRTVAWCTRQHDGVEEHAGLDGQPLSGADGSPLDDDDPRGLFDPEDDPIILRLVQLKRGALIDRDGRTVRYQHVAIDEAQDRSALEVKVLLEATATGSADPNSRSVTIAGDAAQRLVFDNSFTSWAEMLDATGHAAAAVRTLKLSYRSTAEVMLFARALLGPDLAPSEPLMARSGAPVELYEFGDVGESVAFLGDALRALAAREPTASVVVIARYPEQAALYYQGLTRAEVPALRLVRRHEFSFAPGVDVTDAAQVKGLEFDYVIMVEVTASSYPDAVESRHLLHIGATRAAHQLWMIAVGNPSPLLPAAMRG